MGEEAFGRFLGRAVEIGLIDADEAEVIDSSTIWGRGAVEETTSYDAAASWRPTPLPFPPLHDGDH